MCEQAEENVKPTVPDRAKDFLLEEYKRLCSEVDHYIKESGSCVNWAIATSGVVWAWILTNDAGQYHKVAVCIPFVVSFVGLLRWAGLQYSMGKIGEYICRIEGAFLPAPKIDQPREAAITTEPANGWERWLRETKGDTPTGIMDKLKDLWNNKLKKCLNQPWKKFTSLGTWGAVAFVVLVLGNAGFAGWAMTWKSPEPQITDAQLKSVADQILKALAK